MSFIHLLQIFIHIYILFPIFPSWIIKTKLFILILHLFHPSLFSHQINISPFLIHLFFLFRYHNLFQIHLIIHLFIIFFLFLNLNMISYYLLIIFYQKSRTFVSLNPSFLVHTFKHLVNLLLINIFLINII